MLSLHGLFNSFVGEIFSVQSSSQSIEVMLGIIVNLSRDETFHLVCGALLLSHVTRYSVGGLASGMSRLGSLILGDHSLGSIIDPLGFILLNTLRIDCQ